MAKFWERWRQPDETPPPAYSWQYQDEPPPSRTGWKKAAAAAGLLAVVYLAQVSGTNAGQIVCNGVKTALTVNMDVGAWLNQYSRYWPSDIDWSAWRRVQATVSRPADPLRYLQRPAEGKIVIPFGWQRHPVLKQDVLYEGIAIGVPALGHPVLSAASGKVKLISDSALHGRMIIVEHSRDLDTVYGHLGDVLVKTGEYVSQGQVLGRVGKTGVTAGPQVYFEVRDHGKAVDPLQRFAAATP